MCISIFETCISIFEMCISVFERCTLGTLETKYISVTWRKNGGVTYGKEWVCEWERSKNTSKQGIA